MGKLSVNFRRKVLEPPRFTPKPLKISVNGFAFLGALLEPPRLRLRGLHLTLSPSGDFAFCSNPQLEITKHMIFQFFSGFASPVGPQATVTPPLES